MRNIIYKVIREYINEIRMPKGFWLDKEDLRKEALKYTTRKDFRTKSPLAYRWALKYDLFGDTITHLGPKLDRKPSGYWTKEKVQKEALKYTTKKEFFEKSSQAANWAKANGFIPEITKHMEIIGDLYRRAVYSWEFSDNTVYVGLTYNLKTRAASHLDPSGKTQVSKYILKTKLVPTFKLISDYVSTKEAQNLESCTIEDYKDKGWKILNKAKAGGLGTCRRKWTDDAIRDEAKKYDNVADFKKYAYSAYVSAQKYGIFDEVIKNMKRKVVSLTDQEIRDIASKYQSKSLFIKNEPSAVQAARLRGIYDEITKDMVKSKHDTSNFIPPTNEEILTVAKQYSNMKSFRDENPTHYDVANKNGLLSKIREIFGKSFTRWDLDKLKDFTKDIKTRWEFQQINPSAYQSARRQGFLDILFLPKE
jgi:predicted GIY-YIG superfamily endonuclease